MPSEKQVIRFGVFEVDLWAGELHKRGLKIKLQEQPFQVLAILLERPGEVVTREELQGKLWSGNTFVDFDNSLNKAITKIREVLGDSDDSPRFVETLPRRGYRFIATIEKEAQVGAGMESSEFSPGESTQAVRRAQVGSHTESAPVVATEGRRNDGRLALGLAVLLVVGIGIALRKSGASLLRREPVLTQLTWDTGLTSDPTISPDGKLLAYASDRSEKADLDIYVQQIAGGDSVRLTHDPADESEPSFSPDGSQIVFRSERGEGGICVMPSLGGLQEVVAKRGRNPRFSPDGQWITYWDNGARGKDPLVMTGIAAKIYVVPSQGGTVRQVRPEFYVARFPIWTPDGKHLLFAGSRAPSSYSHITLEKEDWWVTPLDGGEAVKTGAFEQFQRFGITGYVPSTWSATGTHVIFSASRIAVGYMGPGNDSNLWQIPISLKTWKVGGHPERLTFGTGVEVQPSAAADGRLVFSGFTYNTDIWSLPIDPHEGTPNGEPKRLTNSAAYDAAFDLSADGSKLVFLSNRSGNMDVWLKDLGTGQESPLTLTPFDEGWPKMAPDGSKVSYERIQQKDQRSIYVLRATGGPAEEVCQDCAGPWDWSSDGQNLLYDVPVPPVSVGLLNLANGKKTPLLKHPVYKVVQAHVSDDNRWITFGL